MDFTNLNNAFVAGMLADLLTSAAGNAIRATLTSELSAQNVAYCRDWLRQADEWLVELESRVKVPYIEGADDAS